MRTDTFDFVNSSFTLEPIRVDLERDVNAGWSKDGKVLAMGHSYRGELWRLTPDR